MLFAKLMAVTGIFRTEILYFAFFLLFFSDTEIVTLPSFLAVTVPSSSTDAIFLLLDFHLISRSVVLFGENDAASCMESPTYASFFPLIEIFFNFTCFLVRSLKEVFLLVPSIEAVILVVPSLCTLIRPFEEMVAIFSLLEDQIIFWDADFLGKIFT